MENIAIPRILMQMAILLFSVSFHEVAHGWVADKVGDPTAKMLGRLTLDPRKHLDLWGSFLVPLILFFTAGFILGWAKPVPVTRENFKQPRRDEILVSAAGPASNFILCTAGILGFWAATTAGFLNAGTLMFFSYFIAINVILGVFNLIPIPPLDGSWILRALLPPKWAYAVSRVEPFGMLIVFGLVAFGLTGLVFGPALWVVRTLLQSLGMPALF